MTIVHVTPFFAPHRGGVETHVFEVCSKLAELEYDCQLLTQKHVSGLPKTEKMGALHIHRVVPNLEKTTKLAVWRAIWQHRQLFQQADIVQVHDVAWWLVPVLPWVWRKLFVTFHGWETQWPIRWQAKLQRWFWAQLARGSMHIGGWISTYYWDKPTAVSYGGVRVPAVIEKALQKKWHTKKTAKKMAVVQFVFLGRLEADNDIELYLSLLAELQRELEKHGQKLAVTWVGDGSLRDRCRAVGKVTGWVADPWPLLVMADVIGASSYLSLWQGLATGNPVVALTQQPLKTTYLRTFPLYDWLWVDADAAQLATKLRQQLSSDMTRAGAQSAAAKQYSWAAVADQYLTLWQQKK